MEEFSRHQSGDTAMAGLSMQAAVMEGSEGRGGDAYTGSEDILVVVVVVGVRWCERVSRRR